MTDTPNGDFNGQSNPPDDFYAYTKNIRSTRLDSSEKMSQLLAEVEHISWDIVLISESRTPSGTYCLDGGHILYTVLLDGDFLGAGILLHCKHVKASNVVHRVSSRVLGLDFRVNGTKLRAMAVYVPHCGYDIEHFNETFDQLRCFASVGRRKR